MPQMGESLTEGTLVRWLKQVGDAVAQDEPLFEISTDKVDTDVPSPVAGSLHEQSCVRDRPSRSAGPSRSSRPSCRTRRQQPTRAPRRRPPRLTRSPVVISSPRTQRSWFRSHGDGETSTPRGPTAGSTNPTGTAAPPPVHRRPVAEVKAHRTSLSTGPWSPATLDAARRGVSLEVLTALERSAVADTSPSATSNGICKAAPPRERPSPLR